MRHVNEIVPYNEFWGNCITNMFTSILQKEHPSYVPLVYSNSYEYHISPFRLDYTKEYYDFFGDNIFVFNRYNFFNKENFLPELKNIIINNPYVTLYVDLFYWNKDCTYYNRIHSNHFAFVIGFDEEEDVFYAFEDDVSLNYDLRKIPTQNVIQAFHSEFKEDYEDYRIITFKNNDLKPYVLDLDNIKADSERLIHRLEFFLERKHVLDEERPLTEITNVHHYTYEFGKISNRMKGNIIFFRKLRDSGIISQELSDELIQIADEMIKKWMLVKNIFFNHCLRKKFSEIEKVEKRISELFIKEKDMWSKLVEYKPV
ncbi:hypothetical protein EHE19_013935 [Ruminiclostridium herbifermentans]|uniref:Butirosin biosynthesis protein H N-terminal domain-containing protein n=1 Tax=Ruminiclostridium herbifermentans TaxID=2488810 RepID=A0A4U7JH27_9FIRM|nr:hypothetical protein [Ruminiclostridium herbifermentans]QNU65980.1 hypothetical protein EHE19_013935 [Ruminiclostridium herbifermentans]